LTGARELVTDAAEEPRLGLVGSDQRDAPLVEFGVEGDHAAVGLLQLGGELVVQREHPVIRLFEFRVDRSSSSCLSRSCSSAPISSVFWSRNSSAGEIGAVAASISPQFLGLGAVHRHVDRQRLRKSHHPPARPPGHRPTRPAGPPAALEGQRGAIIILPRPGFPG
jgi:hypothetical protein